MTEICYKDNNHLKNVIARIDFNQRVDELIANIPDEVKNAALSRFAIEEPTEASFMHVDLSKNIINKQPILEQRFHGKNRDKVLVINPEWISLEYSKWGQYNQFTEDFHHFLGTFFSKFPNVKAKRLGMRYINNFELAKYDVDDWKELFNTSMVSYHSEPFAGGEYVRIFSNLEFKHDDFNVRFQFGIPNQDYPASIRREIFAIDIDAYILGLIEPQDIANNFLKFHSKIQDLFEYSITDKMRGILGVG